MHVTALVWAVTLAAIVVIFAVDLLIVGRRPMSRRCVRPRSGSACT